MLSEPRHGAVLARQRIAVLEAENAALRVRLAGAAQTAEAARKAEAAVSEGATV